MKNSILLLWLCFFPFLSFSQHKIEHEVRISRTKVPQKALHFIDESFPNHPKIHWYLEYGTEQNYESKFKYKKYWYSVEFDTLGKLIDIELTIKWKEISNEIQEKIKSNLDSLYNKHKFYKIQEQLSGDEELIKKVILKKMEISKVITAYEIKIKAKNNEGYFIFEHLYDKNGQLLQVLKIIPPNTDFLEY